MAFLSKYDGDSYRCNDYPETRKTWSKEVEYPPADLNENLASATATAHAEDIEQWSRAISILVGDTCVTFDWLKSNLKLTPAQIYLGIIKSDRFVVMKDEADFYAGFSVKLKSWN